MRIDHTELASLNSYLAELAPGTFGPAKKASIRKEEMVQLPQTLQESDPLEKALEYVPSDYTTLTSLLQEHMQSRYDSTLVKDEEGKEEEHKQEDQKDVFTVCKDHIQSSKIIEAYSKAVDRLVSLTDDYTNFIQLDSSLLTRAYRAVTALNIKNKAITTFTTKAINDKAIKTLRNLMKFAKEE